MSSDNTNHNLKQKDDILPFAVTNFRNKRHIFGIKRDDRRRHVYVIGKTGTGKSTLLMNMMVSDIISGNGLALVDPHGELAETVLKYVPKERVKDVIYFNPADTDFPIAFNIAENTNQQERHLIASGLIGIFKKLWADSWGPRLEYVLRNTILAILEYPESTLLDIMRMLSDKDFRKVVLSYVKDPVIKSFWVDEYAKYSSKFEVEAIAPIQNKVGQFLTNPIIRNIVGQKKSTIDMRDIMDSKKILIINLSKGRIGEDTSKLLGAMMITKIQLAAMSRIDIPEEERNDFYLYVDEFQNFATESFADILSEARKYRLNLILAHQYLSQIEETGVREAVFGNVGTIIVFRVGAEDAEFFEKEFAPEVSARDLVNLPNHKIYLKLMIDGVTSKAFSADTLPPYPLPDLNYVDEIIEFTRNTYAKKREEVEASISSLEKAEEKIKEQESVNWYDIVCQRCGKKSKVPFEPDPEREVYCKECHAEIQREQAKERLRQQRELNSQGQQENEDFKTKPIKKTDKEKKPRQTTYSGKLKVLNENISENISLSELTKKEPVSFKGEKKEKVNKKTTKKGNSKSGVIKPGDVIKLS